MKRNLLKKEEDSDPMSVVSNLLMWQWYLP